MIDRQVEEDGRLFALARAGDAEAFGELVERHKDGLVNYLTRLSGCRETGEDLAQESFLRLVERGAAYTEQGKLSAYLYRIGTNLVRTRQRSAQRRKVLRALLPPSNGAGVEPAQSERLLERELSHHVAAAVSELPLRFRVPIVLFYVEGWPQSRISEFLGCSPGTVKSRIHRGRLRLRRKLEPYWAGGAN